METKEVIDRYTKSLQVTGKNSDEYKFREENGLICVGIPSPMLPDKVQWSMTWYKPKMLMKMASIMVLFATSTEFDIRIQR